jgi:hypothetical protein
VNVWPLTVKAKCGEATLRCAVGIGYVMVQDVAAIMIPEAPRQIILQDKVAGGPPTLRVVSPTSVRLRPDRYCNAVDIGKYRAVNARDPCLRSYRGYRHSWQNWGRGRANRVITDTRNDTST